MNLALLQLNVFLTLLVIINLHQRLHSVVMNTFASHTKKMPSSKLGGDKIPASGGNTLV